MGRPRGAPAAKAKRPAGLSAPALLKLVNAVPAQDLKKFVVAELRKDKDLLGRFSAVFSRTQKAKGGKDYRAMVQGKFNRAKGKKGYIDRLTTRDVKFTDVMGEAKASEKIGDYAGAARIYSEVSESIEHNMPRVYSGTGRFYNMSRRCLERMALCAKKVRGEGERRKILWYILRGWAAQGDGLSDYRYEGVLESAASGKEDYRAMVKMLDDGIPAVYDVEDRGEAKKHLESMRRKVARGVRG